MGSALAAGWLAGKAPPDLMIVDPDPSLSVQDWIKAGRVQTGAAPRPVEVLILAVKPQIFPEAARGLEAWIGEETLVISIMAGISMHQISDALKATRVLRVMPNTPGAIGKGVSVIAAPADADPQDIEAARDLLAPLGSVEGPVDEGLMGIVTALSGSGPAYVFLLAEAMASAGEAEGLDAALAARLAGQTLIGAAALLEQNGETPGALRKAVTSPGGTTQAAIDELMGNGELPRLMRKAMKAAAKREKELSRRDD